MRVSRLLALGTPLCVGLFLFDLVLGGVSLLMPRVYAGLLHPELVDPQLSLIRRTGLLWLGFSTVALVAATRPLAARGPWYLVLGTLRLLEVPADVLYGVAAEGARGYSRLLILCAPPLNLLMGLALYAMARELRSGGEASR